MFRKLIDWWTRPSWEEYLAEQRCRQSAQDRQLELILEKDNLERRLNANASINSKLVVDLCEERQKKKNLQQCVRFLLRIVDGDAFVETSPSLLDSIRDTLKENE